MVLQKKKAYYLGRGGFNKSLIYTIPLSTGMCCDWMVLQQKTKICSKLLKVNTLLFINIIVVVVRSNYYYKMALLKNKFMYFTKNGQITEHKYATNINMFVQNSLSSVHFWPNWVKHTVGLLVFTYSE